VRGAGFTVRVVDPGWVTPVDPDLVRLAAGARLVVTVEDGSEAGGVGTRIAQACAAAGVRAPVRQIGVPSRFPEHGSVADVKSWAGLTGQDIGRRIVEWSVVVGPDTGPDGDTDSESAHRSPTSREGVSAPGGDPDIGGSNADPRR
jgi:1-deoxy-D-xylulose-5-phosphate synthase